jgi:YfiH family protein
MNTDEFAFDFPGGGHALFTTRAHGNLSSVGGEDAEHGLQARDRLREQLGLRHLLRGYQVHGTTVQRVRDDLARDTGTGTDAELTDSEAQLDTEADGQATALRGVGAVVLTADCLPIALGCAGAVAAVHAGWRGLAAGVLEEGVRAIRELGGEDDLVAIVGPGAGPCCYEVGEEVHEALGAVHRHGLNIDLKAIARDKLLAAGVSEVNDVAACTICDERFFSYRREGARAGRQGVVAWLS